jgi:hypothetical protein
MDVAQNPHSENLFKKRIFAVASANVRFAKKLKSKPSGFEPTSLQVATEHSTTALPPLLN